MPSLGPFGGGRGLQGVQGEIGFPGLSGGRGPAGANGSTGPQGEIGIGLPGITGSRGATGAAGSGGFLQIGKVTRTAGDVTTSSTAFIDLTSMSVTMTTGATRCDIRFTGSAYINASANICVDIDIDGTRVSGAVSGLITYNAFANHEANASFIFTTDVLSAGSHTFKIQWRVTGGTGVFYASTSTTPAILTVLETGLTV